MGHSRDTELCDVTDFDFTKIKQVIAENKDKKENWPLYLVSFYLFFSNLVNTHLARNDEDSIPYPISQERYYPWHTDSQHCYTGEDIALVQRIRAAHDDLIKGDSSTFFNLKTVKYWYDWWQCSDPTYAPLAEKIDSHSFTLPTRATKDEKYSPLWSFATSMAVQIANWQSERTEGQPLAKKNDPVMLAFEEFAMWFFNELADKECNSDVLSLIANRLGYARKLIHLIPNFGPDRLHFLEIQYGLEDASKIISRCMTNKGLEKIATESERLQKDVEIAMAEYLHFSVNQKVADNFSPEYLEGGKRNCYASPLCEILQAAEKQVTPHDLQLGETAANLGKFYEWVKPQEGNEGPTQIQLKTHLLDSIKFASFIRPKDKLHYLEAIANLYTMVQTRKTLEKFHLIQSQLGNYLFSFHCQEEVKKLTNYQIKLIKVNKLLIESLIKASDTGLKSILSKPNGYADDKYFEDNLRMLDNKMASQPTMSLQLESSCAKATESILNYQRVMHELASDMQSGQANKKLEGAMNDLLAQMNSMNAILPAILGEKETPAVSRPFNLAIASNETVSTEMTEDKEKTDNLLALSHQLVKDLANQSDVVCHIDTMDGQSFNYIPMVRGEWDETTTIDRHTGYKVYTYRVFDIENREIGSADFHAHNYLCITEDGGNNILTTRGILKEFHITPDMSVDKVCTILPPTLFDRVCFSVQESALTGGSRGMSKVVAAWMQSHGYSKQMSKVAGELSFYGTTISIRFIDYYNHMQELDETTRCCNALYYAAIDTGSLALTNLALTALTSLVQAAGDYVQKTYSNWIGHWIKKASGVIQFGLYANRIAQQGIIEGPAAIAAGVTAEIATESAGRYALKLN